MRTKDYRTIFQKEWSIYRRDHQSVEVNSLQSVHFGTRFDGGVKKGEIRLFADSVPPRMALVHETEGVDSWQVVPVSEFTVPANDCEALVGNRVYQFWNSKPLPKALVARSWIVAVLTDEERKEVDSFYRHAVDGEPLPKTLLPQLGQTASGIDATRLEYEREFVLTDESFDYEVREPVVVDPIVFKNIPFRYAAEDPESQQQSCIICNEDYFSCTLDQPFVSLRKDADPGTLVFSWDRPFPKKWRVRRNARVTLHDRASKRQIGEGRIDMKKREIVIDRFDGLEGLSNPVKKACDAVIVLSPQKGK